MNNNPNNKTKRAEHQLKLNEKYNTNDLFNSSLARKHGWKYISDVKIDERADIIRDESDKALTFKKKKPMRVNKVSFKKESSLPTTTPVPTIPATSEYITTAILTISLSGKMNNFYKSDIFVKEIKEDLAHALGVPSERIRVFSVSEGSIIIEFEILPPPSSLKDTEPSVNDLIVNLKKQINNEKSTLRMGNHMNKVDITIPLKVKKVKRIVKKTNSYNNNKKSSLTYS